jgi:hypothetical protein
MEQVLAQYLLQAQVALKIQAHQMKSVGQMSWKIHYLGQESKHPEFVKME